jgi:uncharacterized membrane protein YphA (DoxX/SURF4 family)
MKILVNIARIVVGLLFIFSGLVKANDPLGLSYKMQEFFEIWGLSSFDSWTLAASILMNAFEIIAGFALLLGFRIRVFSWLLLLLIVFFTFLTGYTYVTGKPTNCGCFGDCLPITSQTSFYKDVILTILIAFIFWKQKYIQPRFKPVINFVLMLAVTLFSFGFQRYALRNLPVVDCLPFKKGNNIPQQMKSPAGAVQDSFAIRFVYEKGGKEFEFAPSDLPADLATYTYKSRTDKLIRKGNAEPPIKGFALMTKDDIDSTDAILHFAGDQVLIFSTGINELHPSWAKDVADLQGRMKLRNIPVFAVTSNYNNLSNWLASNSIGGVTILKCDNTVIRTAARSNPTIYHLRNGTVINKVSYLHIPELIK